MLKEIINRLRGQVRLRITCPYPERVLNLCGARELAFWDLEWQGPEVFTCRVSRRDFRLLRQAAERLECRMEVLGREGAPYALGRLRRRRALAVGAVLCGLALLTGSFFIWDIRITGSRKVSTERILRELEACGVRVGAFGLALDGEDLRNHMLLRIPELSWITVNVSGCRANVEVRERQPAPEIVERRQPCNIVARRPGLVLRVQALGGVPAVVRGASVTQGQLLISGVEDTGTFGFRLTSGMGRVEGRTWYTLTAHTPLTGREKRYTGQTRRFCSLIVGKRRIKIFANSSIAGGDCDKITTRTPLHPFGIPLPLTWETEQCRYYETETVSLDAAGRQAAVSTALEDYLHSIVDPYGTVTGVNAAGRVRGEILTVTLTAECREELGERLPIYTENEPGSASG